MKPYIPSEGGYYVCYICFPPFVKICRNLIYRAVLGKSLIGNMLLIK